MAASLSLGDFCFVGFLGALFGETAHMQEALKTGWIFHLDLKNALRFR